MQVITEELLALARSEAGGWTKPQFAMIGVAWPPVAGWKASVLGKPLSDAAAAAFLAAKKFPPVPAPSSDG